MWFLRVIILKQKSNHVIPLLRILYQFLFASWIKPSYGDKNSHGLTIVEDTYCVLLSQHPSLLLENDLVPSESSTIAPTSPNWEMVVWPKSRQSHSCSWDFESWTKFIHPVRLIPSASISAYVQILMEHAWLYVFPSRVYFLFITFSFMG